MAGIAAALIGGAAAIGGGLIAGSAARSASKTQARAAQQGMDAQREMFEKQTELQEPFRQAGLASQNQLLTLLGLQGGDAASGEYGSATKQFGMDQFNADPGYAFRLSEGMKALERSSAARGGLLSGSTLKGINRYGQDMASTEYQNAFNRYQAERSARLNPLQSMRGAGQSATNQISGAAGQLGQGLAQGYGNLGQAQASGYVGAANAAMGGVQGISNAVQGYYNNQFMNNFMNRQSQSPYSFGAGGYTGQGPFYG